jgi:23S rRNA (adenine2503-C2)-methyltransferase
MADQPHADPHTDHDAAVASGASVRADASNATPTPLGLDSEAWVALAAGRVRWTPRATAPSPRATAPSPRATGSTSDPRPAPSPAPSPDPRPIGGVPAALAAYRAFYRDGVTDLGEWNARDSTDSTGSTGSTGSASSSSAPARVVPLVARVPPVVHTLREDSPEGEVIKFITRVGEGYRDEHGRLRATPPVTGTATATPLEVESVLIPMVGSAGRLSYTLCVSSQVGCAMGCTFCETAQMGLIRSLTSAEIAAQWWNAAHVIGIRPKNIVFMGMGEPMDNLDNVLAAIGAIKDHNGGNVAVSQVTISTVGRVDGIRRLREHVTKPGWHRLGLALSLNAPNNADRSAIMPVNRRYSLEDVRDALLEWPRYSANKVCVEYVLIPGVNDTERHAQEIADFMAPFGLCHAAPATLGRDGRTFVPRINGTPLMAMLNLIPYNPRRNSPWPAPAEADVDRFLSWLIERGVFAKRRRTKGRQMMGACGQLGAAHIRQRTVVPLSIAGNTSASPAVGTT